MRIRHSVEGGGGRARPPWPMAGPRGWDRQAALPPPPFLADRGHRQGTEGPPPLRPPPPPLPHKPESGRGAPPPPPRTHPSWGATGAALRPPRARGGAPTHRRNGDTVRAAAAGPAPTSPHRRAGATRTTEHEGGRAPHDPPVTTAHSEGKEGGFAGQPGPPGERSAGRPSPPPAPGRHVSPDRTRAPEGRAGNGVPRAAARNESGEAAARRPPRGKGNGPPPPERGAGV